MAENLNLDGLPTLARLVAFPGEHGRINVVEQIGGHFRAFGILLLNDDGETVVDSIVSDHLHNFEQFNLAILKTWLEGNGRKPTVWRTLVQCLYDARLERLAENIEKRLKRSDPKELYTSAMKNGYVERKVVQCLIIGAAGVGKTSIKHLLLKKKLPDKRISTGMLVNPEVAVAIQQTHDTQQLANIQQSGNTQQSGSTQSSGSTQQSGNIRQLVSISWAGMEEESLWHMVQDDDEELGKFIADLIKTGVPMRNQSRNQSTVIITEQHQGDTMNSSDTLESKDAANSEIQSKLIKNIVQSDGLPKKLLSTTWIHFMDTGGQPAFHDLLPMFVKNTSVVLLVFKLTESLHDKPMVEVYGANGPIGKPYPSYLTNKEILEQSLRVFHAQGDKYPTILLVGTHKDCKPLKFDIDELKENWTHFQHDLFHFRLDQPIILLDCFSENVKEQQIVEVRKQILNEATFIKSEETPIAWFWLELALKQASRGVLTLEQCKIVANELEYFKHSSSQFEAALQHFIAHNIFLHYEEVLPGLIFCNPQVLLSMVTQIVQYHYKIKNNDSSFLGKISMFVHYAFVTTDIIKNISEQNQDQDCALQPKLFLALLSHLNVIAAIDLNENPDIYFMPTLLSNASNPAEMVSDIKGKEHLPPLCISFDSSCAPSGLFCCLIASLIRLQGWKLRICNAKPYCCLRNCVALVVGTENVVFLIDSVTHFVMHMYIPLDRSVQPSPVDVRKIVHESIRMINSSLKLSDAIPCPSHPAENHVAVLRRDCYVCLNDNAETGSIPNEYQIWLKNADPSNLLQDTTNTLVDRIPNAHKGESDFVGGLKLVFLACHKLLVQRIEPTGLMIELISRGVISMNEKEMILKEGVPSFMTDKLLTLLHRKAAFNPAVYDEFLLAMEEEETLKSAVDDVRAAAVQRASGGKGTDFTYAPDVMDEGYSAALKAHEHTILAGLTASDILPELVSEGVVSPEENESIREGESISSDEQAKRLLKIVRLRGSKGFLRFKDALLNSESQQQLGRLLMTNRMMKKLNDDPNEEKIKPLNTVEKRIQNDSEGVQGL